MKSVIVIGGGFAGLSAATALAKEGHRVTVLEGRQVLGGRAYSFMDPLTGDSVDNGQHLFMGCYKETLDFLGRIGTLGSLTFQHALYIPFVGAGGRHASIRCMSMPSPWHLYSGLLRLKSLSIMDRLRLRFVHDELQRNVSVAELDSQTVDQWLIRCKQSERARRNLWDLITIACLNEDPRVASAATFVAVLKQAFFGDLQNSQLAFSSVGLTELYVPQSIEFVAKHNGEVRTRTPVHHIDIRDGRAMGVQLRNGMRLEADAVISAVPPWALTKLVPDQWVEREPYFNHLKALTYAPIISIHLWFEQAITDDLFAGLLDTHIQWLFNRSRIHKGERSKEGHISLVISGAHGFADWTDKKILSMALEELKRLFPEAEKTALLRSLVIKESHATLSPKVGTEALRPTYQSPIENLFVAGDWTNTGLPATIESACISGHACAALVAQANRPPTPREVTYAGH